MKFRAVFGRHGWIYQGHMLCLDLSCLDILMSDVVEGKGVLAVKFKMYEYARSIRSRSDEG
jgi:hypothetical protein